MPLDKSMTFGEIVKEEMDSGKPQKQAVAIAYKTKGENKKKNLLNWRELLNTKEERFARGTERYASKKEMRTGEDEASEEEHEEQYDELLRKREDFA